jgi:hypothetical protein
MMEYLNFKKLMTNHLKDMHSKKTKKKKDKKNGHAIDNIFSTK